MFLRRQNGCVVTSFERFQSYTDLIAVVSTRKKGISVAPYDSLNVGYRTGDRHECIVANRQRFCASVGADYNRLAYLKQVHGNILCFTDTCGELGEGDGLITDKAGIFLVIHIADCIPVFLFEPENRALALLHAGWRGIAGGIIPDGVEALQKGFNAKPETLVAALGPHLRSCCYSVDEDVADMFPETVISKGKEGKWMLDLTACAVEQLIQSGIPRLHIEHEGYCTACDQENYYSYRRDKGKTGRMMALFGCL